MLQCTWVSCFLIMSLCQPECSAQVPRLSLKAPPMRSIIVIGRLCMDTPAVSKEGLQDLGHSSANQHATKRCNIMDLPPAVDLLHHANMAA